MSVMLLKQHNGHMKFPFGKVKNNQLLRQRYELKQDLVTDNEILCFHYCLIRIKLCIFEMVQWFVRNQARVCFGNNSNEVFLKYIISTFDSSFMGL